MLKLTAKKITAVLLTVLMVFSVAPAVVFAQGASARTWDTFVENLKILEQYAENYVITHPSEDEKELVINFIRTGVEKYSDNDWAVMAGKEKTGFTNYVKAQDTANGTTVTDALRPVKKITVPNGQQLEFSHLFGALNIAYHNNGANVSTDFGSWAGDLCDLMEFSLSRVTSTDVDSLVTEVRENCFGVDVSGESGFGMLDVYGDLDAYYLMSKLSKSTRSLSEIMERYFTDTLTDTYRAAYFLKNRFPSMNTQQEVRDAVLAAYNSNSGCGLLEADRGLENENNLRAACCYVFADYLYELAKDELPADNTYYEVFSSTESLLAPGIKQEIKYATTADDKQIVYYIATADIARDDVHLYANYGDNDGSKWQMTRVTDQVDAAYAKYGDPESEQYIENYAPIVSVNGDFFNTNTGQPTGALVMEGVTYQTARSSNFFAVLKDGTPVIGTASQWSSYANDVQEAVGASIILVKDGKIAVSSTADYYTSRASRTCVGITEDGEVVLMVLDGRQEPFSAGGSSIEIAQIMLEAGCVQAVNLDGGGSTTYAAKPEGEDKLRVVNSPSDGYQRSVSSSLMVVSTAETSTEFDHAVISGDYDYLTPGSQIQLTATGVSKSGNAAAVPENAVWLTSDTSIAVIDQNGVLTATTEETYFDSLEVEVQLYVDGTIVGNKTVNVVWAPDEMKLTKESMNIIYGVPSAYPIEATYNGNPVAINPNDVEFEFSVDDVAVIDGFSITVDESSGIRNLLSMVSFVNNYDLYAIISFALFNEGEAMFDFDSATAGDRQLAWNRTVNNATTIDEKTYSIIDPDVPMDISYTFAMDMEAIEVPEILEPILGLVAGGDVEGVTAWQLLLQLAERINPMTYVKVSFNVDPNLDVDISNIKLVNEYFSLTDAKFNEQTSTVELICNFIKQSEMIDAATANPVCIVSGIKVTPKEDAEWTDGKLEITNCGNLSYDIYLRAGQLYSFSSNTQNQQKYNVYPFVDTVINPTYGTVDKGGHFAMDYAEFEDTFTLSKNLKQGWIEQDGNLYYFVDGEPINGINKVPSQQDTAVKYYYDFGENGVCKGKVTGTFTLNGQLYYAVNGESKTGWRLISENGEDNYYYFSPKTGAAVDGVQAIDGHTYTFTNKILTRGDVVTDSKGSYYYWAGRILLNSWIEIDGKKYRSKLEYPGYFMTGRSDYIFCIGQDQVRKRHYFDENGVWQEDFTGKFPMSDGKIYYVENGIFHDEAGVRFIDGYYYYFSSRNYAVTNCRYWVTVTNGLMSEGWHNFDEQGRMTDPPKDDTDTPETPETPEVTNGIVSVNGKLYYYVEGIRQYCGLIKIGDSYYYAKTSTGELVRSMNYWTTVTNGLMSSAFYNFDENGKMTNPPTDDTDTPEVPDAKNGLIEENGVLYYYINNVRQVSGLTKIGEDYYYISTSTGEVIRGRAYWVSVTHGIINQGIREFDENGKMLNPPTEPDTPDIPDVPDIPEVPEQPEVKNGIVDENGTLYHYNNGVLSYAGLIEIDGYYYYVSTSTSKVASNQKYWVSVTNGLPVNQGYYEFGEDGKMLNPPEVSQ